MLSSLIFEIKEVAYNKTKLSQTVNLFKERYVVKFT